VGQIPIPEIEFFAVIIGNGTPLPMIAAKKPRTVRPARIR
jgi:hypothetical protein